MIALEAITRDTIVRTVWGEARGEGPSGWLAVIWVIRNRVERYPGAWWGKTYAEVCLHPWQFSCWKLETEKLGQLSDDDKWYVEIAKVVDNVFSAEPEFYADPTQGCCFYKRIGTHASWDHDPESAAPRKPKIVVGRHEFFDLAPWN